MQFLAPNLLWWIAGLGALALVLYLFRRRPKQVRVSTLPFFKSLAKVYQESAWLRRLKKLVSFLLSAIVICAAAGALARMVIAPRSDELHSVIVLIDTSASMGAVDEQGGDPQVGRHVVLLEVAVVAAPKSREHLLQTARPRAGRVDRSD